MSYPSLVKSDTLESRKPEYTMLETAPKTTIFSLPTELRLQIAGYVLEQEPNAGFICQKLSKLSLDPGYTYKLEKILGIRLVCRQFNHEFTRLAFQSTTFLMSDAPELGLTRNVASIVGDQPDELVKDVKKLIINCAGQLAPFLDWGRYPFNRACMHLHELSFVMQASFHVALMADRMRQLQNVKMIRFMKHRPLECYRLMATFLRRDHYHRYDAPYAPNVGRTWWEWSYSEEEGSFTCTAQDAMPVMEEQDYMVFATPKVDRVMECIADLTS
jgi:hypothetical protein